MLIIIIIIIIINKIINFYTGSRHHSWVVLRRDLYLIKSILNKKKNTKYVKQIIKSTKSHCSYQNYA